VKKKHIWLKLPVDLKREIDALAGPRKRSAFFAEAVAAELSWRRLRAVEAPTAGPSTPAGAQNAPASAQDDSSVVG
jgi:hypothetical protein